MKRRTTSRPRKYLTSYVLGSKSNTKCGPESQVQDEDPDQEIETCSESDSALPLVASVSEARRLLKGRLFGHSGTSQFWIDCGLENQKSQIVEVLQQCVSFGESNSILLIGPRGSGKSKLIEVALSEVNEAVENYYYVYLSGIIQTDDRTALQEIARQLELENVIGDQVKGSFADTLAFILDSLKSGNRETRSIVFVLDEFDLFAQHKNQSLLYNLFDVSQSKQTPVAVIGVTCRLDVVELLEKRVRSRYSHRCILTFTSPKFKEYLQLFRDLLLLPGDFSDAKFASQWEKHVECLAKNTSVQDALRNQFHKKKDIRSLMSMMIQPVCRLSSKHPFLLPEDFMESTKSLNIDTKSATLRGLSVLELCLIIAMKHVLERRSGEPFNFEMVFEEYRTFVLKKRITLQLFEKAVAMKAFEHLLALELVRPIHNVTQSSLPKEFRSTILLIDHSQISETLQTYPGCPTELKNWTSSMFA